MGLLDDILAWSGNLPTWQSDALRRLLHSGALNAQDFTELLAMVKQQHGDGAQAGVQPIPLQRADIPHAGGSETVRLLGLNNLQHVNRFPSGRAVSFEPARLNVLFGENGAGKSGYPRHTHGAEGTDPSGWARFVGRGFVEWLHTTCLTFHPGQTTVTYLNAMSACISISSTFC